MGKRNRYYGNREQLFGKQSLVIRGTGTTCYGNRDQLLGEKGLIMGTCTNYRNWDQLLWEQGLVRGTGNNCEKNMNQLSGEQVLVVMGTCTGCYGTMDQLLWEQVLVVMGTCAGCCGTMDQLLWEQLLVVMGTGISYGNMHQVVWKQVLVMGKGTSCYGNSNQLLLEHGLVVTETGTNCMLRKHPYPYKVLHWNSNVYNILHGNAPSYLCKLFSVNYTIHNHNTRNSHSLHILKYKLATGQRTVKYRGTQLWLSLNISGTQAPNFLKDD